MLLSSSMRESRDDILFLMIMMSVSDFGCTVVRAWLECRRTVDSILSSRHLTV